MDRIKILSHHLCQFRSVEQVADAEVVQSGTSAHLQWRSSPVLIGGMVMDVQVCKNLIQEQIISKVAI